LQSLLDLDVPADAQVRGSKKARSTSGSTLARLGDHEVFEQLTRPLAVVSPSR
jgi:hypothetical protein